MNDLEEVQFGLSESNRLLRLNTQIAEACGSPERAAKLFRSFDYYHQEFFSKHLADTYVFCLSEHQANDYDGLLSMWRGYGGGGNGAAIVIDTAKLTETPNSPLMFDKVFYATGDQRRDWISAKLNQFCAILRSRELPDDVLHIAAAVLFNRFKMFALFSKHKGFDEEKEWRIVYLRDRDQSNVLASMFGYLVGPRGIEPKLKFKIELKTGFSADDLSLEKIVDRILLGPSVGSPIASATFKRMLVQLKEPALADKVFASSIPFRVIVSGRTIKVASARG